MIKIPGYKKTSKWPKILKKRGKKVGTPPGTPIFVGRKKVDRTKINIISYNNESYFEQTIDNISQIPDFLKEPTSTWIDVVGLHDVQVLENLANTLNLHLLVLEDIINTDQRPKIDDYDNYLFLVIKLLEYSEERQGIVIEQISLILGENYVISFQESPSDIFNSIKDRIKHNKGRIRQYGVDYLFYTFIDIVVDNYFVIMEKLSDRIEDIEDLVVAEPGVTTLREIHHIKTNIIYIRKAIWPLREVISRIERGHFDLIQSNIEKYLRDVYDHTIQIIDTVETLRDIVSSMLDIYLSSISNKMNEVMKVLTIIATITIPMTVVSGIYGMNFANMPELEWILGYPLALLMMISVAAIMIGYFWRKNWL